MATLLELCDSGDLVEIDPGLDEGDLKWRCLYGTPEFVVWLDHQLPTYPEDTVHAELSPIEQVATCMLEYVTGERLSEDRRFKKLRRTPSLDVWELKTDDVRIFGWVPRKDAFICCFGDHANDVKLHDRYALYMAKTHHVRTLLCLDEPKSVTSGKMEDVISDKA